MFILFQVTLFYGFSFIILVLVDNNPVQIFLLKSV